jgi:hypothetical protein
VTDAVYPRLNLNARIPLCGLIAHYNDEETGEGTPGPKNFQMALMRRALIKGFIVIGLPAPLPGRHCGHGRVAGRGQAHSTEPIWWMGWKTPWRA